MDKKKILIICLIIIVLASIATSIYIVTNKEEPEYTIDGINLPANKDILKDRTIDNLKITKVSLLTREGKSTYKALLTNDTDNDIDIDSLYVIFYEGEKETKVIALKNSTISSKNKTYINISSESDLSKTTKIEYMIEKNEQ